MGKEFFEKPSRNQSTNVIRVNAPLPMGTHQQMKGESDAWAVCEEHIEDIFEWIIKGETFEDICRTLQITMSAFFYFRNKSEYAEKIEECLQFSGEVHQEKARKILEDGIAIEEESVAQTMLRKELASYHKWIAGLRDRKRFGKDMESKVTVDVNHNMTDDQFGKLLETAKEAASKRNEDIEEAEEVEDDDENEDDWFDENKGDIKLLT